MYFACLQYPWTVAISNDRRKLRRWAKRQGGAANFGWFPHQRLRSPEAYRTEFGYSSLLHLDSHTRWSPFGAKEWYPPEYLTIR